MGTRVSDSDSSRIFIDFRLDQKWPKTWLDLRKRTREYFKSNSSLLSLNTSLSASALRRPQVVTAAPFKWAVHQNSGADHITSARSFMVNIVYRLWYFSALYPLVFFIQAIWALSLSLAPSLPPDALVPSSRVAMMRLFYNRNTLSSKSTDYFHKKKTAVKKTMLQI